LELPSTVDFLVVGAGIAGLRAAIELAEAGSVLVLAKGHLRESSSEWAQGGIAVALADDDEVSLHEEDTISAGAGLCDREAVRTLVEDGPAAIEQLIAWGAEFDREGSRLAFAREGAHSRRRVLHAHGDSTGKEITRALFQKATSLPRVRIESGVSIVDLLTDGSDVAAGRVFSEAAGAMHDIAARAVLLATGGLGRVFQETTNPDVATGDGVAVAYRAGAEIADIEFVQFHPTALRLDNAPRFLLSEALRGEGAYLRTIAGDRFMHRYHPMAELAPRDVVSRAIVQETRSTSAGHVLLDLTHLDAGFISRRFPRIYETCVQYGLDLARRAAPVYPAAHYAMGGIRTDLDGRASLGGLYAAGESACTGVHGANRLASNSLLEALVFGARAGRMMRGQVSAAAGGKPSAIAELSLPATSEQSLRELAWSHLGVVRCAEELAAAINSLSVPATSTIAQTRPQFELCNMHLVACLIAQCALARRESRGAHFRTDHPAPSPEFQGHSVIRPHSGPLLVERGHR
jgi:L-aspartate oxidase